MIKELKKMVLALMLIQLSTQCGEGCLKCSTDTECELCDSLNAYVLREKKCVRQLQENCKSYNLEGSCTSCANNFYLLEQVRKCIAVENINIVENCQEYNSSSLCQTCQPGFYLAGNKCVQVDLKIENCQKYDTSKTCSSCISGYLLSINGKQCLPITKTANCLSYSLNKCINCNDNSLMDPQDYYHNFLLSRAQDFTGLNRYQVFNYFSGLPVYYQEFCIRTEVPNCAVFENYQTCKQCNKGFYLQENKCKENPKNFISNCKGYKNPKECNECLNGFYLFSPTQCLAVDKMDNCQIYDGKASFSSCLRCIDTMFLQTSTTCTLRLNPTIPNCTLLHSQKDFCQICGNGFSLTVDNLKCLPLIANCLSYDQTITSTADSLKCQICKKGYYLLNNVCEKGTVDNCLSYQVNADNCELCLNKYYLEGGACKLQSSLSYCQDYNPLVIGKCDTCQIGTQKFTQNTYCNPVNQILNCIQYSDVNTCQKCDEGYNKKENKCLIIPSEINCLRMENDLCLQCKDGFYFENGQCKIPLKTEMMDCHEEGLIISGYQKCKTCEENYISYNYLNHQMCFNYDDHFKSYVNNQLALPINCQKIKLNGNVYECTQCKTDFYLTEQNLCIGKNQCIGSIKRNLLVLQNDKIVDLRRNVCINVQSNCTLQAMKIDQNNTVSYVCAKCSQGNDKIIDFTINDELILTYQDLPLEEQNNLIYRVIKPTCELSNQTQRKPSLIEVPVFNNCEYWYKFTQFGEKGCSRCQQGYYGEVKNWGVKNCQQYDPINRVCSKCLNNYSLSQDGLRCNTLTIISHCNWYLENNSTCQKCDQGYYLSNNQCLSVTQVQNCKNYHLTSNKCLECNNDFTLYQNQAQQQFCIKPIYKCQQYRYITSVDDIIVCTQCADGYYPDTSEGCIKGTVVNCWQYEQVTAQNVCKKYINQIPFLSQNYCQRVGSIEGCLTYTSQMDFNGNYQIVCSQCNSSTHYKSGELCCPYGMYNNLGKCDYILINECKQSTSALSCDICNDYYFFDLYMNELSVPYKCCGVGTYWNPVTSKCSKYVELIENNNHCILYEKNVIKSCLVCEPNYYISQNDVSATLPNLNGYCCPIGQKYVYSEINGHTCESISTPYCGKVNCTYQDIALSYKGTVTCECTSCQEGYTKNGTGASAVCCNNLTEYYDSNSGCLPLPNGCAVYDAANSKCTSCKTEFKTYTKTNGQTAVICCDYKANPRQWYQNESGQSQCTNQGQTSQNSISFVYSGDANCILTNFNSTHQSINEASCIACVPGFSPSGYKSQKCCKEGTMWNGIQQKCLHNQFFNNCIQVNILTSISDAFCLKCRSGYYLNNGVCTLLGKSFQEIDTINHIYGFNDIIKPNCLKIEDGTNVQNSVCTLCKDGYSLNNGVCSKKMMVTLSGKEYFLPDLTRNCSLFNYSTLQCLHCKANSWIVDGNMCCLPEQKLFNNQCVDPQNEQEKIDNIKLKLNVDNCSNYEGDVCIQCNQNFILIDEKCVNVKIAQSHCHYNIINENCTKTSTVSLNNCTCDQCSYFAYNSNGVCCPYGTRWNNTLKECKRNIDSLCARHDGTNCLECFEDPSRRLIVSNYYYTSTREQNYIVSENGNTITTTKNVFEASYYLQGGICCPINSYNKNGQCIAITRTGCKQAKWENSLELCTLCIDMQKIPDDNGNCINRSDTSALYTPTNSPIQLLEGMTWDYLKLKPVKILDPNCLRTSDIHTCSTCVTNYSVGNQIAKFRLNLRANKYHSGVMDEINVRLCLNLADQILDQFELRRFEKCLDWNPQNGECTECDPERQLTRGICCEKGKVGINYNGITYCASISEQQTLCDHFDINKGYCYICTSPNTTNFGSCCGQDSFTKNTYMDMFQSIKNCDLKPIGCKIYNVAIQQCELCEQTYKMVKGVCYQNAKTLFSGSFVDTYEIYPGCAQQGIDGKCMTAVNGNYIYRGIACPIGLYSQDGDKCQSQISLLGDFYQYCTKLNNFDHCTECTNGSYITNNRCCLKGMYFDIFVKKCLPIYKFKNCSEAVYDKNGDCTKCMDGYYLSRGFCVLEGKYVSDDIGTEQNITITNCLQAQNATSCQKCTGDQVIFNNTCQFYIDIDEDQRIGECKIIQSGTPPTCLECKDNKYLNSNNCCSYGFYFNGSSCQSLETISKNCKTWINNQCTSCLLENGVETYLSNQLACCINGTFASSSTFCKPIQLISNCLQTDNEMQCNMCAPGFKQVNGNCIVNDIVNCSIGKDKTLCLICNDGFYLNEETNVCTQQPQIQHCIKMEKNTDNCAQCDTGRYWDGYSCCLPQNVTIFSGVQISQVQCTAQNIVTINNCSKIQNQQCVECTNGNSLSNGQCCPSGQYPVNGICTAQTGNGLTKCKQYDSITSCSYLIDDSGNDVSCIDNYYFTKNRCCPLGTYWNDTDCTSFTGSLANCKKMIYSTCNQCSDGFNLSQGQCIASGNYLFFGVSAIITAIPQCKKIDPQNQYICMECNTNYTLTLENRCCSDTATPNIYFFDPVTRTCIQPGGANTVQDKDFKTAKATCKNGEYANGLSHCCNLGEIYNTTNSACQAPQSGVCNIFSAVDDETDANCLQCTSGNILLTQNGTPTCETKTAQKKHIYTTDYYEIPETNYNNCKKKSDLDLCTDCDSANSYILLNACVDYNNKWTSTTDYTQIAITVTDCKKSDPANMDTNCVECKANNTLTDATTCTAQAGFPNTNCLVADANLGCTKCDSVSSAYTDAQPVTICCKYYEEGALVQGSPFRTLVAASDFLSCQPYMFEIEKCIHYDQDTNQCAQCINQHYLSDSGVCCKEGFQYSSNSFSCVEIQPSLKCLKINNNVCSKCIDDPNVYLTEGHCCTLQQYYDGTNCVAINGNCEQSNDQQGTCIKCLKGYNLFTSTCCPIGQHLNVNCVANTISNCEYQSGEKTCKKCLPGFVLFNLNKYDNAKSDFCCTKNQYFDLTNFACASELKILDFDANCLAWDRKNLRCGRCQTGFYLTNGRCCADDSYWDIIFHKCRTHADLVTYDTNTYSNCLQVNDKNVCIKCAANFFLRNDNVCKQPANVVLNCAKYDDLIVKCIKCNDVSYLHRDKCPTFNSQTDPANGNIVAGTITNCSEYEIKDTNNNNCLKCTTASKTYVTNNNMNCCLYGQFYNTTTNQCETTTLFSNCIRFTTNTPTDCLQCDKGYFLGVLQNNQKRCIKFSTPDQECLLSEIGVMNNKNTFQCTKCKNEGKEYVLLPDPLKTQIFVKYEPIQNCEQYETTDLLSNSTLKCIRCIDNDLNYLVELNGIQQCLVRTQTVGEYFTSHCTQFDPLKDDCLECKVGYYLITVQNTNMKRCQKNPTNCKIWVDLPSPQVSYCAACEQDFEIILINGVPTCVNKNSLIQKEAPEPTFYPGFTQQCVQNEQCQGKYMGGLNGPQERLFSCHLCKLDGYIPFVSVRTNNLAIEGIQRYHKPESTNQTQDVSGGFKNSDCLRVSGETFGIDDSNFNFPQNCSLGIINSNIQAIADSTFPNAQKNRLGVYCTACQPGYKPLKSNLWNDYLHVYSCEFIPNCKIKGNSFNQCQECEDGFTFLFQNGFVDQTQCVEFRKDQNCMVSSYVNNVLICKYCEYEYSFNYDGVCEKLENDLCGDSYIDRLPIDKRPTVSEVSFFFMRFQNGFGCQQCPDDQISFNLFDIEKSWFCTASQYVQNNNFIDLTKYDPLCRYYQSSVDILKCLICQPNAVLNNQNVCILRNQSLNNCQLAQNNDICLECEYGYILSLGKCKLKDIENCVGYMINIVNGDLLCSQCDIGYGLNKNVCVKDLFNPCLQINETGECIACQYGFQLVTLQQNDKKCVPVSSHQNCLGYNSSEFDNKRIQCNKCLSNNFILQYLETPLEVCNQVVTIRNCIEYDIKTTFSISSLKCIKCDPSYYLSGNECFLRRNLIDFCTSYQETSEMCISCEKTHYLDSTGRFCIENPTGVDFCRIYESNMVCSTCNTNYYPLNGKCVTVDKEKLLQGCYTYDNNQGCIECQQEQMMLNGKCVSILAQNCLTFSNEKQCATCNFGFELTKDEIGIVSCTQIQKPIIQNCSIVSDTKPFTCLQCFEHHYFDLEKCVEIEQSKRIEQCDQYENSVSCKKCQKYYILSQDKTLCILEKNRNCQQFQEEKTGFCVICQPGFVLNKEGKCVEENSARNKNCLLWEDESSMCLICQSNYSMTIPGTCVENQSIKVNPLGITSQPQALHQSFEGLLRVLALIFLII